MAKYKVNGLSGPRLDWAAAVAIGAKPSVYSTSSIRAEFRTGGVIAPWKPWHSNYWGHTGMLVASGRVGVQCDSSGVWIAFTMYNYADERRHMNTGATPNEALTRTFVESKLGPEVEIPDHVPAAYMI